MSIVLKALSITVAIVIAVGILGTTIIVGSNLIRYMNNQGFDFNNAINWSWKEYTDWIEAHNPFKATAEEETIPFANQYIDVVPCINL